MSDNDYEDYGPTIDKDGTMCRQGRGFRTDGAREVDEAVSEMMQPRRATAGTGDLRRRPALSKELARTVRPPEAMPPTLASFLRGIGVGVAIGSFAALGLLVTFDWRARGADWQGL